MINPELDRRLADCTELIDAWRYFIDLINRAVKNKESINPQMEQQFLGAKARIAMLHDSFMESLRHDRQTGANMLEIVNRSITLRILQKAGEADSRKLELEWHEAFLLLNETVSTLNEERQALADVNEFNFKMKKFRTNFVGSVKAFLGSFYFKVSMVFLGVIFVIFGVEFFGIYRYDKLRDYRILAPIVGSYLDLTRDAFGMQSAYYSAAKFQSIFTKNPPLGYIIDDLGADPTMTLDAVAVNVTAGFQLTDAQEISNLEAILRGSGGDFKPYRIAEERGGASGNAFVFWFRQTQSAKDAMRIYNLATSTKLPEIQAIRKVNVVVVLYSAGNPDFVATMRQRFVDKMSP